MTLSAALYAVESEEAVIGAAMYEPARCSPALDHLTADHFAEPASGVIWQAILDLHRTGQKPIPTLVRDRISGHGGFDAWGGFDRLFALWDRANLGALEEHVAIVRDRHVRRQLVGLGRYTAKMAEDDLSLGGFDHVAELSKAVTAILHDSAPDELHLVDARSAAVAVVAQLDAEAASGRPKGLMTGLRCFDRRLRGLRPGWLVVLAGRPSMGKTALGRCAAMGAARRNPDQLFVYFALEMDREELSFRSLSEASFIRSRVGGIPYFDMVGDKLLPQERAQLAELAERIPTNFIIDDSPVLSVEYIRRRLHALKRRGPIGAVFIDYLQIMQRPEARGRNEAAVIGEMTQALKQLARELDVCIVLLSQVNRGVEGRENKKPQMSDLRESGSIEQDANVVMFVYREVYYLERDEPKKDADRTAWEQECALLRHRLDVLVPKFRGGPAGSDRQEYHAEFDHVEDVVGDA